MLPHWHIDVPSSPYGRRKARTYGQTYADAHSKRVYMQTELGTDGRMHVYVMADRLYLPNAPFTTYWPRTEVAQ